MVRLGVLCSCWLAFVTTGCSSWNLVERHDGWSLYSRSDAPIEAAEWEAAFEPALIAVEEALGPLGDTVSVHAWTGSVGMRGASRDVIPGSSEAGVQDVPGIGPARIQAWHARGRLPGAGGIFISEPDAGTAAHELVHAHLASSGTMIPLWLEEGLATVIGDGALFEGRWVIDGLAAWPLTELRLNPLDDEELLRLLRVRAGDDVSVRDNVLVHFIGWAIAFDFYRETGHLDWQDWIAAPDGSPRPLLEARARLERSLSANTVDTWLSRLEHPDPGQRLACVRGLWKLRDDALFDRLVELLEREPHPEVQAALAVNLLVGSTELRLGPRDYRRLMRAIGPVLREPGIADPERQEALRLLGRSLESRGRQREANTALEVLSPYWRE